MTETLLPAQLGDEFLQDPHSLYRELRDTGPVRPVRLPHGLKVWLVTRYEDARAALTDPRLSKDMKVGSQLFERHRRDQARNNDYDQSITAHMLNTDPPDHTRLRKLVNRAFTAGGVERLRPRIEQITAELLDALPTDRPVDLIERFAFPLPITVICELLGVPVGDRDAFRRWSTTLMENGRQQALAQASAAMAGYLSQLVDAKRSDPRDDLLTALVQASDEQDSLSSVEVVSMAFLLLVAGHETTVNLIGNGVLALLGNPDQLAVLRADPALLPCAVEEFLRYDGPINLATFRHTAEQVEIGGIVVPAGEFVLVSLASANRDEHRYPEPDRLDVTRRAGGHLAFGHGIHYCVGAPLARLEGEVAIGALLHRFPGLRLGGEPERLRWRASTLMRGLETLPVLLG